MTSPRRVTSSPTSVVAIFVVHCIFTRRLHLFYTIEVAIQAYDPLDEWKPPPPLPTFPITLNYVQYIALAVSHTKFNMTNIPRQAARVRLWYRNDGSSNDVNIIEYSVKQNLIPLPHYTAAFSINNKYISVAHEPDERLGNIKLYVSVVTSDDEECASRHVVTILDDGTYTLTRGQLTRGHAANTDDYVTSWVRLCFEKMEQLYRHGLYCWINLDWKHTCERGDVSGLNTKHYNESVKASAPRVHASELTSATAMTTTTTTTQRATTTDTTLSTESELSTVYGSETTNTIEAVKGGDPSVFTTMSTPATVMTTTTQRQATPTHSTLSTESEPSTLSVSETMDTDQTVASSEPTVHAPTSTPATEMPTTITTTTSTTQYAIVTHTMLTKSKESNDGMSQASVLGSHIPLYKVIGLSSLPLVIVLLAIIAVNKQLKARRTYLVIEQVLDEEAHPLTSLDCDAEQESPNKDQDEQISAAVNKVPDEPASVDVAGESLKSMSSQSNPAQPCTVQDKKADTLKSLDDATTQQSLTQDHSELTPAANVKTEVEATEVGKVADEILKTTVLIEETQPLENLESGAEQDSVSKCQPELNSTADDKAKV